MCRFPLKHIVRQGARTPLVSVPIIAAMDEISSLTDLVCRPALYYDIPYTTEIGIVHPETLVFLPFRLYTHRLDL